MSYVTKKKRAELARRAVASRAAFVTCKEHGICARCRTADALPGHTVCEMCLAVINYEAQVRYIERIEGFVCPRCKSRLPAGRRLCPACRAKQDADARQRRADRRARGLCTKCGKLLQGADVGYARCAACREKIEGYKRHQKSRVAAA